MLQNNFVVKFHIRYYRYHCGLIPTFQFNVFSALRHTEFRNPPNGLQQWFFLFKTKNLVPNTMHLASFKPNIWCC